MGHCFAIMRENRNHTFQISEKPFIIVIILIFIVIIKENYTIVNESITVEMINIEATFNSQPDENRYLKISMKKKDETLEIKEVFNHRHEILQRSCEFINKLNTANRKAAISQLKEIHLVLQDLEISRDIIAKKLSPYDETNVELDKDQEYFIKRATIL